MKIKKVSYCELSIPLKEPYTLSHSSIKKLNTIIVKIETEHAVGLGEATVIPVYFSETTHTIKETLKIIANRLKGEKFTNITEAIYFLKRTSKNHLALSAVEMAVYDAFGKEVELPLYELIGGKVRDKVELIGSIGISSIKKTIELSQKFIDAGFKTLKIKVGKNFKEDIKKLEYIKSINEKVKLRVDANEAYTLNEAIKVATALENIGVELFEQPLKRKNLEELKILRKSVNIPIMVDESVFTLNDLINVINNEAADMVKLKVMKSGIFDTKRIATIAGEFDISCIIGNGVQTELGAFAEVHLAASVANIHQTCECVGPLKLREFITKEGFMLKGPFLEVPKKHGIGVTLKRI
jgi:L-alanine-DL-glutamate epimerase-like enolase superfamily enzyme